MREYQTFNPPSLTWTIGGVVDSVSDESIFAPVFDAVPNECRMIRGLRLKARLDYATLAHVIGVRVEDVGNAELGKDERTRSIIEKYLRRES